MFTPQEIRTHLARIEQEQRDKSIGIDEDVELIPVSPVAAAARDQQFAIIIAEFAKPTDAMIDAAYEAVRFDEAWAINSRQDFVKAVKAMVRSALGKRIPA